MSVLSRRQFLAGATATAAAIAVPGLASAAEPPDWAPDHITNVGDDEAELRKYEPYLDIAWDDQEQLIGTYGWYMDSEEYDTRAYYYWLKYAKQDSLADQIPIVGPLFSADSHFKDHEPVAVFADRESGEVQKVLYSGYHHFGVQLSAEEITLVEDERSFPTHPRSRSRVHTTTTATSATRVLASRHTRFRRPNSDRFSRNNPSGRQTACSTHHMSRVSSPPGKPPSAAHGGPKTRGITDSDGSRSPLAGVMATVTASTSSDPNATTRAPTRRPTANRQTTTTNLPITNATNNPSHHRRRE